MLVNVLFSILLVTVCLAMWLAYGNYQHRREAQERREKERQLARASSQTERNIRVAEYVKALKHLTEKLDGIPELIQGLTAMCQASADQLDQLKKMVDLLTASMSRSGESEKYEEYAEETPAAVQAQQRQEIRDLVRSGVSQDEAVRRVREKQIYESWVRR